MKFGLFCIRTSFWKTTICYFPCKPKFWPFLPICRCERKKSSPAPKWATFKYCNTAKAGRWSDLRKNKANKFETNLITHNLLNCDFKNRPPMLLLRYICLSPIPENRQSFTFQKITETLKLILYFENLPKPSFYCKEKSP